LAAVAVARHRDLVDEDDRQSIQRRPQPAAIGQIPVLAHPDQKMAALTGRARQQLVNITLAIRNHRHLVGPIQRPFCQRSSLKPAIRFLLLNRKVLVILGLAFGSVPQLQVG